MSDQDIRLRLNNKDAIKQAQEANRAIERTERAAADMGKAIQDAFDKGTQAAERFKRTTGGSGSSTGGPIPLPSTGTQSSIERQLRSLERRAALAGKTGSDRLIAERDFALGRIGGDERAIQRVTAAYEKLIAAANSAPTAKVESFFGSFLKAGLALSALEQLGGAMKRLLTDSTMLAANTEMYGVALRAAGDAAGYHTDYVVRQTKAVADLGIVLADARQAVSRMMMSGMDIATAPTLARMAQNLSVLNPTETSSSMFQRLVYGIQSGQTEVLRTGGVNVNFESKYSAYAREQGKTINLLTEEEKLRIRLNTVLAEQTKSEGLYEQSLGTTGKQLQSLKRFATDAQVAIGENLLPALGALVSFATWAAKVIAENPVVARGLAVGGAGLAGGAVGAGIGFMVGGPAGAVAGAKIGGSIGLIGGLGSAAYSSTRPPAMTQLERSYPSMRPMLSGGDGTAYEYLLGYTRPPRSTGTGGMTRTDEAAVTKALNATRTAQEALTNARIAELDGVDKILAEYDQMLDKLKQEGVYTKKLAETYREVYVMKMNAYLNAEFAREAERLTEIEERGLDIAKQRMAVELDLASARAGRNVDVALTAGRRAWDLQGGRIEDRITGIRDERELALLRADTEAQKLSITLDFIEREKSAQLDLLNFKAEIQRREIAIRYAGNDQAIRLFNELIDAETTAVATRLERAAGASADSAKAGALANEQRLIRSEYQRTFDSIQRSAEGLFDALIVGGRNFGEMLKRTLLIGFLTPIKQAFSTFVATMLTGQRAAFGSVAGVAPTGGGGGLAALGALAPIVGGPGGTGGFNGPVGGGMGGYAGMFGNPLGGLTALGNIGMNRGPAFVRDGVMSQNLSTTGVGGWQGGALLAGGGALGAYGLMRGGWSGMAMTTAGGAMIGYKFGGPVGAAIGAGVGAAAGLIRMMFKGRDQKIIDQVRSLYSVTIDKQFAKVLAEQSRGQDLRVFLASPGVREQIEIYASYTGQRMAALENTPRGVNLSQSGGSLFQTGSFVGGIGYGYSGAIGSLPGLTPFGGASSAPIILDASETRQFWSDAVEQGIVRNPRAVQSASNAATAQSFGRVRATANLTDPLAATI